MTELARNVWCLLGLPIDSVNMEDTIEHLYSVIRKGEKCFLSTPNLNFLISSQKDNDFKVSVINSNLSVADGKPLIIMARLLNIPLPERVAGSDLIETLIDNKKQYEPIKVFFFGGMNGIAEKACKDINITNKGLKCVGYHNPGFGSIEEMSSTDTINKINNSGADFVIVSLGAKKGQAWIQHNFNKLDAVVISHLGAVINFIAGNVKRSPKILQKLGLEWLWRVKEEPSLWKRYFIDGIAFLKLLVFRILPLSFLIKTLNKKKIGDKLYKEVIENKESINIQLKGNLDFTNTSVINNQFTDDESFKKNVHIIIQDGSYIDGAFIAKILILKRMLYKNGKNLKITSKSNLVTKIFYYNCCESLL